MELYTDNVIVDIIKDENFNKLDPCKSSKTKESLLLNLLGYDLRLYSCSPYINQSIHAKSIVQE